MISKFLPGVPPDIASPPQPPLTSSRRKIKPGWALLCLIYSLTRHHELSCHFDESSCEDQFAAAATVAVRPEE